MWIYKSPIGDIIIERLTNGRYGMIYDSSVWEASHSPEAEADNIYRQCTGCPDWDLYDTSNTDVPTDLSKWKKL